MQLTLSNGFLLLRRLARSTEARLSTSLSKSSDVRTIRTLLHMAGGQPASPADDHSSRKQVAQMCIRDSAYAVAAGDLRGDGQPQARALAGAVAGAVKALEDPVSYTHLRDSGGFRVIPPRSSPQAWG